MSNEELDNANTERETPPLNPPPAPSATTYEKKIWAFRAYYGILSGGFRGEGMTQQEVADALGVSRWTVDRWLNREQLTPMALSPRERWMLFGLGYSGNPDEVTHYARLLALERESETDVLTEEPEDGDVPFPEDFSL